MRANSISHEVEGLKKSLDAVGKRLASLSEVTIREGKSQIKEVGAETTREIEDDIQLLIAKLNEVTASIGAQAGAVDKTIHEKPYWFLAAAGGLGFLLGKLLQRR